MHFVSVMLSEKKRPLAFIADFGSRKKFCKLSLSYRVPLLYNKLLSWDVLPSPGDLSNCGDVSINDLGHQIFDCYEMGNEDLIRFVYGLSERCILPRNV